MLKCRDLAGIASDYIDGELGPLKRLSVNTHLLMCRDCRNFISHLRASVELMQGHSSQRATDEFVRRVDEQVKKALADRDRKSQ